MYLPCIYHVSTARDHWPPQPLFTILNQQRGSGNVAWLLDTQQTRAYLARTERGRNEDEVDTDHFDINQLLYCHHSAIFLTKYCDLWWCHCSVRCGYESASIWTLKQYLEKLPTFHVQFSFHCQGFPLVTKIFSLITKDFPLITKDFPFVKASNQPTEPFHIHSLLHPYVGMITNRLTQNKSVALDTSRRRVLWKLWISMRNKDWRTLLDSKEYGVCWADAGVTKARAHQLSSSRCSVTCYGAVQQQPAPTIPPRSGCAHCWVLSSRLMQCKYFYPLYLLSSCCYTRHFTIHYFASTEDDGIHIMHPNPPQP